MKALTIQKLIGIAILIATVIIVTVTGEGTVGIFLGIIGIGLVAVDEVYIEFLKEQPKESNNNGKRSVQRHFN